MAIGFALENGKGKTSSRRVNRSGQEPETKWLAKHNHGGNAIILRTLDDLDLKRQHKPPLPSAQTASHRPSPTSRAPFYCWDGPTNSQIPFVICAAASPFVMVL